jgi:hypothetical protein
MRDSCRNERGDITVGTMWLGAGLIAFLFAMLVGGGFLRAAGDQSDRSARRAARAAAMTIDADVYRSTGDIVIDRTAALEIARTIASRSGDSVEDLYVTRDETGREIVVVEVSREARLPVFGAFLPAEVVTVHRRGSARLEPAA